MKIALFSDNFYPELSGISDSLIALARALAVRGHEIRIYAPRYAEKDFSVARMPFLELSIGERISIVRLPSVSFPAPTGQGRASIFGIRGFLDIWRWNPDVIHTQLFFGVGLSALLMARLLRKPLIGTNHTAAGEFVRYFPVRSDFIKRLFERYVAWYYNRCVFVTGPSDSVFPDMVASGFRAPHRAVSNPVDTDSFSPVESAQERKILRNELKFSGLTLAYAGRLSQEKNIDTIIRALPEIVSKIPDAVLAIAGRGLGERSLKDLADELGVGNHVRFLGMLGKQFLVNLYRASDIFVITSTSETQGLSMMQAMAAGLPVIAARSRSLPEYVNPKNGILISPGDYKSLAEEVIGLYRNHMKMKSLGAGGHAYAGQFSPENIAEKWEEIYRLFVA